MKIIMQIVISLCLLFAVNLTSYAAVPATGEFTATKKCQAYQSMRRKTNPGDIRLELGENYPIVELNRPSGTTWYRVSVEGANPQQRWTYFECGTAKVSSQGKASHGGGQSGGQGSKQSCSTAGEEDSFVFAISWQPAFCESHQQKPECKVTDPNLYQAKNFTLHGLWPNKQSCGTHYGFCGDYKKTVRPFCNYAAVPMKPETLKQLGQVMPSAAHGSCLQRHEWYKHGTCQTEQNADGYFDTAMRLLKEFNDAGLAKFMQENIGKTVSTQSFFDAVDQAFQEGAHQRLQISCSGGKLQDVYINLPAELAEDASLADMLKQAPAKFNNKCGQTSQWMPLDNN